VVAIDVVLAPNDKVNRGDHNAIWTPPNLRRKLEEAKSPSAFYYKTSVRRAASVLDIRIRLFATYTAEL
jgi:hypothetical protein